MNRTREQLLPILCHWITFLAHALPLRSAPTLIELVVGALLSQRGWVTAAYLAIAAQRHWTSYYKWLQQGRWSWLRLGQYLAVLLRCSFPRRIWYLVVDDSINCRASPQAPSQGRHYNHSRKVNRPLFLQGQCWVLLAAVLSRGRRYCSAIPLLARLQRTVGNRSKLRAACVLLRAVGTIFQDCQVRVLLDCWYMRRRVIQYAQGWGFAVLGQVRRDTALYALPVEVVGSKGRRGRPRRYGRKYTPERVATLPEHRVRLGLYGKGQWVRYRSAVVKARFLKGQVVRVVWVQFETEDGALGATRLLLATEADLRPEVILKAYARRWPIEPLFNQLRHGGGAGCLAAEPAGAGTVGADWVRGVCPGATAGTQGGGPFGGVDTIHPLAPGAAGHRRSGALGPATDFRSGEPAGLVEPKVATIPAPAGGGGDGFRTAVGTSRLTARVYNRIEQDCAS